MLMLMPTRVKRWVSKSQVLWAAGEGASPLCRKDVIELPPNLLYTIRCLFDHPSEKHTLVDWRAYQAKERCILNILQAEIGIEFKVVVDVLCEARSVDGDNALLGSEIEFHGTILLWSGLFSCGLVPFLKLLFKVKARKILFGEGAKHAGWRVEGVRCGATPPPHAISVLLVGAPSVAPMDGLCD